MGAGKYSAGRIFLQVVPSFKGVQKEIGREVAKYSAAMEKDQVAAAKRTGEKVGKAQAAAQARQRVAETKAADRAAVAEQQRLQRQVDAAVAASNKIAEAKAREQKKIADEARKDSKRARERALDHQRRLREIERKGIEDRENLRTKAEIAADREQAKAEQREIEAARRHQRALEREELRGQKNRERADLQAKAAELRRAQKQADDLEREARKAASKEEAETKARQAREARDLATHHANLLKAQREYNRRRGGESRAAIERAFKGIDDAIGVPDVGSKYEKEFDRIRSAAKKLQNDLDSGFINVAEARKRIRSVERDLQRVAARGSGAGAGDRDNARTALNSIRQMRKEYQELDRAGSRIKTFFGGANSGADDGANAFRIFNYRVLAVASSLPLLAPLLAVTAGGLVALGTAAVGAGAGLGVMLLGFSGVGDAVKALGDVQDNAAKDSLAASKAMRNAARGVRDAQQSLDRARTQGARAAEDSAKRVAAAEKKVADTQKDATKAQVELMEARTEAQRRQQDLADQIAAGKLDERQALIDLFNAQVDYNSVMASGGSTNLEKEQSSINLERARLAIKNIREENAALLTDQKKAAVQGIGGDAGVQAAQQRVLDQQEAQKQAVQDLADARRDASEQAVDSQIAIRDAQERLSDAQAAYQEAVTKTGDIGSASMQKLEQAMGKLSPAGRGFALFLSGLRDDFYEIRNIAQEGLLPGVQEAMEEVIGKYGPEFKDFIGVMATQMGNFFRQVGDMLTSPVWQAFFEMMAEMAPQFSADFGTTFLNFLTGAVALMTAFAPYAADVSSALVDISAAFADWASSLKGSEGFQKFLEYLDKTGPKVWDLIMGLVRAFVAIGVAIAPIADKLLDGFIKFLDYIAGMDPETLSFIVTSILGFVLASQLAAGAMQAILTITTPFHSIFGALVFILVAAALGFLWMYQHSDKFRETIDKIVGFIREHKGVFIALGIAVTGIGGAFLAVFKVLSFLFGPLRAIQMIFTGLRFAFLAVTGPIGLIILGVVALVAGLIWAYKNVDWFRAGVDAVFSFIGKAISLWWNNYAKPILGFFWKILKDVGAIVWWFWTGVIGPVFELIGAVFSAWWNLMVKPAIDKVGGAFGWLGDKIGEVWTKHIEPWLDKFGLGADDLKRAWDAAISGIGKAWEGLKAMVYKPIEFIVNTVINKGFVDNFNKLAEVFGTSKIPHLVLPSMSATAPKGKATAGGKNNAGQFYTGGYTGDGAKYAPAGVVHANEYVIKKESTNRIRSKYGLEVLDYMNRFGDLPGMGGYASGGLVEFGKRLQSMGFHVGENKAFGGVAPVHAKNSWHYRNGAIDVNWDGHGQAFENAKINSILGLAKQYGLRTIWQYPNHYDHAHFDIGTGPDLGNFAGAAKSNKGAGLPWYLDKPIDFMRKAINSFTEKFDIDGVIGDFVTKVPLKVLDFAAEKIQNIISGGNGDFDSKNGTNDPMFGVQQWRSTVMAALARVGQSQSLVDVVLRRMNQESSGDAKAINLWDMNAKNGDPSRGLMQVIGATFKTFRDKGLPNDIYNPMSNIVASMNYALSRYGSLEKAYNRPGGYADGGLVTDDGGMAGIADNGTMMYDNGGYLPPGLTTVLNLTGKPEPVFTADQFDGMRGGGGGPKYAFDIDLNGTDVTAGDVASEIMWAIDREEHGGKFAGKAH
jgi:hypothetical protein